MVSATGDAVVSAAPDQVRINIGVITQAATAELAAGQNAKQTAETIAALKKLLGSSGELQTSGYNVTPNYRYQREGGTPTINGYTASNTVLVISNDIASSGKLIDAATKAGANNVNGISFSLQDEQNVRAKALALASQKARSNAEAMAAGLKLKLGRILRIDDSQPVQVYPAREMMMAQRAGAAADTPVEPGKLEIRAIVTVSAELIP